MLLFPALDIYKGCCVRRRHHRVSGAPLIINENPVHQAKRIMRQGFSWLHLRDLDADRDRREVNREAILAILAASNVPVQLVANPSTVIEIEEWLTHGVARLVLSSMRFPDARMVAELCRRYPGRLAIHIEARDGYVLSGNGYTPPRRALDLALRYEDCGLAALLFTDTTDEGALGCVNIETTIDLAFSLSTPMVVMGGVSSLTELAALKAHEQAGIEGVVCGSALHDGRIRPAEALSLVESCPIPLA
ncbi:MAG: 1-(5-phosphoribosyl)-5-((5-phosphoribosylamino)methylideneamino)imidazole-4-carboxamide isomerase [Alphaproteobacteria bacterium]|nr:MAG: 1-(5-phosphoribosyl)-5-((5-phosphoribosylamino)methylideneamino)imidazole-4-carboxamide isomerase [Alphaproteobacteria bacterium]